MRVLLACQGVGHQPGDRAEDGGDARVDPAEVPGHEADRREVQREHPQLDAADVVEPADPEDRRRRRTPHARPGLGPRVRRDVGHAGGAPGIRGLRRRGAGLPQASLVDVGAAPQKEDTRRRARQGGTTVATGRQGRRTLASGQCASGQATATTLPSGSATYPASSPQGRGPTGSGAARPRRRGARARPGRRRPAGRARSPSCPGRGAAPGARRCSARRRGGRKARGASPSGRRARRRPAGRRRRATRRHAT